MKRIPSSFRSLPGLSLGVVSSPDFSRRVVGLLNQAGFPITCSVATYSEAWDLAVSQRPHLWLIEVGLHYGEKTHELLRTFMQRLRERQTTDIYVLVALTAPEKLFFGGDLLYLSNDDLSPSGFVDTFLAVPPGSLPSIMPLSEQVLHAVERAASELARRSEGHPALPALGSEGWVQSLADPRSRELWMQWLPRYAGYTNENPIIIGETGTGKTNLAYALHSLSGRKGQFVGITPRDFSSSELVQAELFGAVSGAYTGAVDKWGLVKSAEKGTLFIDELQSIDKDLQGKLITFIENKAYRRVGSAESVAADVRFVFASNRTLYDMMESDVLRHDFAYRLERVQLELPPLSMRRLDITAALAYALAKVRRQRPHAFPVSGFTSGAYRLLFGHSWPGNLRQLENSVARLCEFADMQEIAVVDEQTVADVFETRLKSESGSPTEVLAQAALIVAQEARRASVQSLSGGVEQFVTSARNLALEVAGGDTHNAAALLNDDCSLLELLASVGVMQRETELLCKKQKP